MTHHRSSFGIARCFANAWALTDGAPLHPVLLDSGRTEIDRAYLPRCWKTAHGQRSLREAGVLCRVTATVPESPSPLLQMMVFSP